MEAIDEWQDESNSFDFPVVMHCMDGASQSGLLAACMVVSEIYQVSVFGHQGYGILGSAA